MDERVDEPGEPPNEPPGRGGDALEGDALGGEGDDDDESTHDVAPSADTADTRPSLVPPLRGTITGYALLAAAEAAAFVTLLSFVLLRRSTRSFVGLNHLPLSTRQLLVASLALAASGAAGFTVRAAQRTPDELPALQRSLRLFSPLLPLVFVPPLLVPQLFDAQPITVLLLAAVLSLGTAHTVAWALPDAPRFQRLVTRHWPQVDSAAWVLTGATFWWLASRSIRLHHKGLTSNYDLGLFENLFWNTSHGVHGIALELPYFDQHAELILYPLSLIYRLFPSTETLLILQAMGLAGAIVPLYLLGRRWFGPSLLALVLPLVYAGFPAIHGTAFYDFHFLALSPVFVTAAAYAFVAARWRLFWPMVACALLCREDVAIGLAIVATGLFLLGRHRRVTASLALVSLVYFLFVKLVWMRGTSFVEYYEALLAPGTKGFPGVLATVVTNPLFVAQQALTEDKLLLALHLLVPTLFLPVRQWRSLFLLFPGTLIVGLAASGSAVALIHFHYSCHFTPYLFVATILALAVRRPRQRIAAASGILVAATIASVHFGALFRDPFRASFHDVSFAWSAEDQKRYDHTREIAALIPPEASVAASEYEGPLVTRRRSLWALKEDVGTAEFIFYGTPGLRWGGGPRVIDELSSGRFGVVFLDDQYGLLRRGAPTKQNAKAIAALKKGGFGS
jgi:uncharacterized membrane protein